MAYTGKKLETKIYDVYTKDESNTTFVSEANIQTRVETYSPPTDLSPYSTTTQMNSAISTAVDDLSPTKIVIPTLSSAPATQTAGQLYYDSTAETAKWSDGSNWIAFGTPPSYYIEYMLVGGGSGATGGTSGVNYGSGGAGGVLRTASIKIKSGDEYVVTIGAGGTGVTQGTATGGGTSSLVGVSASPTATGGYSITSSSFAGANNADHTGAPGPGGTSSGGGAGAGANASGTAGGAGAANGFTGSTLYFGGGGGGTTSSSGGAGGIGGGGNGSPSGAGTNGTAGLGGGAGGSPSNNFANGGSGVVKLAIPSISYSGITSGNPSVTTSGSNTILTFTASGSYTA